MPVKRVVVEADLCIDRHHRLIAFQGFNQAERIDLDKRGVAFPPRPIDGEQQFGRGVDQVVFEAERGGEFARLIRHHADRGIDGFPDDFLRRVGGDFLDIHAALGAGHHDRPRHSAVEQDGDIEFPFDDRGGFDKEFADDAALRAGLFGDEHLAEHGFGAFDNLVGRRTDFDSPKKPAFECTLAAAAGVNLRFDDDPFVAGGKKLFCSRSGFCGCGRDVPRWHGHAHLREELLGLVFVDVHRLVDHLPEVASLLPRFDVLKSFNSGHVIRARETLNVER